MQAAHVAQNEDGCLAYEISVSTDDPDAFIIYER
jgi:quinol monooxygenase YgiN